MEEDMEEEEEEGEEEEDQCKHNKIIDDLNFACKTAETTPWTL